MGIKNETGLGYFSNILLSIKTKCSSIVTWNSKKESKTTPERVRYSQKQNG